MKKLSNALRLGAVENHRKCGSSGAWWAEGQRLPACHILFIYNFQCATLTSVTFQLVEGGGVGGIQTERQKKGDIYCRSFCFCCRRRFAAQKFIMNVQKQAATAIAAGEMHRHRHGPSFVPSRPQSPKGPALSFPGPQFPIPILIAFPIRVCSSASC